MFLYPFRAGVRGWLLALAAASALTSFLTGALEVQWFPEFELKSTPQAIAIGVVGFALDLYCCLLALKLAVGGMRSGAKGSKLHSRRDDWIDDDEALQQVLLWAGVLLCGYLLFRSFGTIVFSLYCALLVQVLPAVLVTLGMGDSLIGALRPTAWQNLFYRTGTAYLVAAAKVAVLALAAWLLQFEVIPPEPRWLSVPLSRLAWLFALFAGYHELGRMLDSGGRVATPVEAGPAAVPADLTEKEELAMGAASRYAREQRFARGSRELQWLCSHPGTSPRLHSFFRELLAQAGNQASLLAHAQPYVAELLSLGQEREALALYEDSLTMDPHFELVEPVRVTQLLQVLLKERKDDLAIQLATQFLRRFPDEADAVPNGLAAARLLDRQDRGEQARALLVDLVRRFPAHPQRGELQAALETLERVARRG